MAALGLCAGAAVKPVQSETTVAIVHFPQGVKFIGFPTCCPGSDCSKPNEDEICAAELYQGPAITTHHFSGPRFEKTSALRFTSHAFRQRKPLLMLVVTRQFADKGTKGEFANWWRLPEEDGRFCISEESLQGRDDDPVKALFLSRPLGKVREVGESYPSRCLRQRR